MLQFGLKVSGSPIKSLAANTAATASIKEVVRTGKSCKVADTSCHHLSQRDLAYFSSEKFANTLKAWEDGQIAFAYGKLIASRKRQSNLSFAWELVDAIIYVDIFDAHYDGFNYSYEEVRDLFKGYRSQALRELKSSKGFNTLVLRELVKALEDKSEMRYFLRAINRPVIREKLAF